MDTRLNDEVEVLYGQLAGQRGIVREVDGSMMTVAVEGQAHLLRKAVHNISLSLRTVPAIDSFDF